MRTMDIIKLILLKIVLYFDTISSHYSKSASSLESQRYFKKMKDDGKRARMHIKSCIQTFITNEILYVLGE